MLLFMLLVVLPSDDSSNEEEETKENTLAVVEEETYGTTAESAGGGGGGIAEGTPIPLNIGASAGLALRGWGVGERGVRSRIIHKWTIAGHVIQARACDGRSLQSLIESDVDQVERATRR